MDYSTSAEEWEWREACYYWEATADRYKAALEAIIRHRDCKRLIAQIACEALERREG